MDEHPGSQRIPLTLNKYLYGNADPVNHIDPSGNFTMGGMMSGINTGLNLTSFALDIYSSILGNPNDDKPDGRFSLWDAVMTMMFKAIPVNAGMASSASFGQQFSGSSRSHKHHTVPVYMCEAKNQKPLASISSEGHKQLHSELYKFKVAGDVVGFAVDMLVYRKKFLGGIKTPTQRLGRTPQGRAAIAAGLGYFYMRHGWFEKEEAIGVVFPVAAAKFSLAGNYHSYPSCSR
jgi:hypothetical protein